MQCTQSIQSSRLSLQSFELASPAPSPASECCPPPPGPSFAFMAEGHNRLLERGWGEDNSDEWPDILVL
jgi:hypothetical protein